jgi:hypothetical protein
VPAAPDRPGPQALPWLDADGLLRFGGRWVAIPDTQIPAVSLLVRRCRQLVRRDELWAAYEEGGGHIDPGRTFVLVSRLRARLEPLGLQVLTIRGRGVVLDVADLTPPPTVRSDPQEEPCCNS